MGEVDTEFPLKTLPETKNGGWRRFSLRRDSALGRRESSAGVSNDTGLRFQSVCVDVSDKRILWDVSGQASPGHVLAVMGPSGEWCLGCDINNAKGWSLAQALYLRLRPGTRRGHWATEVFFVSVKGSLRLFEASRDALEGRVIA